MNSRGKGKLMQLTVDEMKGIQAPVVITPIPVVIRLQKHDKTSLKDNYIELSQNFDPQTWILL
jgi:hypothetical protein